MNRFILTTIGVILLASCGGGNVNTNVDTSVEGPMPDHVDSLLAANDYVDSTKESLASWLEDLDAIHHDYIVLLDKLWRFGRCGEAKDLGDLRKQFAWHSYCQQHLAAAYDSLQPSSGLDVAAKADSMIANLERFMTAGMGTSTFDMLINSDMDYYFLLYRQVDKTKQLLNKDKTMIQEIEAWNQLQTDLTKFVSKAVVLNYYGGTLAGPMANGAKCNILAVRNEDLDGLSEVKNVQEELSSTRKKLEQIIRDYAKECFDQSFYNNMDNKKDYKSLCDEIKSSVNPLVEKIDKWIESRTGIPTVTTLNKLTETVKECIDPLF